MKVTNLYPDRLYKGLPELWVLFAHPDDEALFFFQLIKWLSPKKLHLVCVETNLVKDSAIRNQELISSSTQLGGTLHRLNLRSLPSKHLDHDELTSALKKLPIRAGVPILSHGVMGEYGHPAHIDIFLAAGTLFYNDLYVLSGPLKPHISIVVSPEELTSQSEFISSIYKSQKIVWNWSLKKINLTCIKENNYFPDILQSVPRVDFINLIKRFYQSHHDNLPVEAQNVSKYWDTNKLQNRLDMRITEWEKRLHN